MGKGGEDYGKREVSSSKVSGPEVFPAWGREVQECEKHYGVSRRSGLSSSDVEKRRKIYGLNELEKHEGPSIWSLILEQFQDTLVRILLVAAVISFITAFVEPLVIFLILIANAIVGVWQENNAEKALEALKEIQSEQAAVIRNNQRIPNLPAKELVPGDIVELKVGDKVPADMRVVELISSTLRLEQGSLTGESEAVNKTNKPVPEDADIQGKRCMVFAGTTVVNGNCICLVTQTGMETEIGKVHTQIHVASQSEEDTPLKKKLNEFGESLTVIIGVICALVWLINIAVALAVAAIPEGLPAVITTCLALGTRKMAQKNALVRKLPSVETLGCTTVICSDKTGTLTTNQMAVAKLISAVCNDAGVAQSEHKYVANGMPTEAALKVLVEKMGPPAVDDDKSFSSSGDLLRCCQRWNENERRIATLEFDRDRKSMGVIVNSHSGKKSLLVKGAVENLLERSNSVQLLDGSVVELGDNSRSLILEALHEMSSGALRCLGFAYKDELPDFATYDGDENHPAHGLLLNPANYSSIERNLTFVGLVGLRDPPRAEVHQAIEDCRAAGIRVMVITGDNKNTAEAICHEIGVFGPNEDIRSKSLTGKEFMELRDQKAHLRQNGGLLFSRAEPRHKQEIVRLLKEDGEVVAMTGDGVNDAPALKLADIGIAMGIAGTEVAKEASDMVLADDNFSTIVAAVGEGRSIYNNMKAFIRYMISSNIGEVASIFLTAALGIPEGLIPVQLLWVNLVTDGPPATALGFNPPDRDIMKKPPRRSDDSLISAWILFRYLVIGLYVGIATVGVFVIWYTHSSFLGIDLSGDGHTLATTLSLSVLVAIEMFNSLNALSEDGSLLVMPPWVNPWLLVAMSVSFGLHFLILYVPVLAQVFGIVPLSLNEWLLVLAVAFPVILIDEILKLVGRCTSGFQTSSTRKSLKPKSE
ncbi:unnamed protein product, partial [Vitis vinifera]